MGSTKGPTPDATTTGVDPAPDQHPPPLIADPPQGQQEPLTRRPAWVRPVRTAAHPRSFVRSISWIGLGLTGVGFALLVAAFSGVDWYHWAGGTQNAGELHDIASSGNAAAAAAYFGGPHWLAVLTIVACSTAACMGTGAKSRAVARLGLAVGVLCIAATVGALAQLAIVAEQQHFAAVFKDTAAGPWLALLCFLTSGIAGQFRRRRDGHWRWQTRDEPRAVKHHVLPAALRRGPPRSRTVLR